MEPNKSEVYIRSLNKRQQQGSSSILPAGDENWNDLSNIEERLPDRRVAIATIRGYSGNYVQGHRGAETGPSPIGEHVRSNTFGVRALPPPKFTDPDTRKIQEAKIDPEFDLHESKTVDLSAPVEVEVTSSTIVKL